MKNKLNNTKLLFNIDEVSNILDVNKHVLRQWEQRLKDIGSNLLILKKGRDGKRRYYRKSDIQNLKKIKYLLHNKKYTMKGVAIELESKISKNNLSQLSIDLKELSLNIRNLLNIQK